MTTSTRHAQAGMTALGFLIIATFVGVVGLAGLKVTPMYLKNMRMTSILTAVERDLSGQAATPTMIRQDLAKRFSVEDINMDLEALKIAQSKNGYTLRVTYEERAPYIANLYLVLAFDMQVEIRK